MNVAVAAHTDPDVDVERGFYLYGVVPAGTTLPEDLDGMGGDGLHVVERGRIGVVGEWIDLEGALGRKRHLVAHSEVLNTLARRVPVLPLQFGSVVVSEEAASEELLAEGEDRFAELLEEVRGLTQYLVKARYDLDQVLSDVVAQDPRVAELREITQDRSEQDSYSERVELGERVSAAMEARRTDDAAALEERIAGLAVATAPHQASGMDALTELAVCVQDDAREDFEDFEDAMELLAEEVHTWARLSLVGPMALYDFVPEA